MPGYQEDANVNRLVRNKEAARRLRIRRKEHLKHLETRLQQLCAANKQLTQQNQELLRKVKELTNQPPPLEKQFEQLNWQTISSEEVSEIPCEFDVDVFLKDC